MPIKVLFNRVEIKVDMPSELHGAISVDGGNGILLEAPVIVYDTGYVYIDVGMGLRLRSDGVEARIADVGRGIISSQKITLNNGKEATCRLRKEIQMDVYLDGQNRYRCNVRP